MAPVLHEEGANTAMGLAKGGGLDPSGATEQVEVQVLLRFLNLDPHAVQSLSGTTPHGGSNN